MSRRKTVDMVLAAFDRHVVSPAASEGPEEIPCLCAVFVENAPLPELAGIRARVRERLEFLDAFERDGMHNIRGYSLVPTVSTSRELATSWRDESDDGAERAA